jgi:hypothetical protein
MGKAVNAKIEKRKRPSHRDAQKANKKTKKTIEKRKEMSIKI